VLKERDAFTLTLLIDLIYPDLLVPGCDGKMLGLRRKGDVGNAIFGGVRNGNVLGDVALSRIGRAGTSG